MILGDGELIAYLDRSGRRLSLLVENVDSYHDIAREVAAVAARTPRMKIQQIDEVPAQRAPFGSTLTEWGFVPYPTGLAYRG